ncbi:hypothetical protein A2V61_02440 [Candidatus Woesebacteria bacterium RBG_19FT_COMBO_47_8]|uniref:Uncharacterized protein n=1 Tax=Candidatus Woesebacteria bacterium RBG_13_46_13 TaxID=1802479 RepID=A0A1F7X4D9_9BACT|nr:MAG: hypothetical protein A2Y68_00720 [Candidatus Woesebacteria bacterium RBG_13_46_13]OGM17172.1 MAG: hypothetical protein A2V61_02440 [Candidatus Woesebacteria bacterium RBG_19FT_COMBO_47_8]HJX59438.1 hypothetical protein [Patescibacteria group bacterium]
MSPERTNYNGIPTGIVIEKAESPERQKILAEIVKYGMGFSRGKIQDASSISLQVAAQRPVFLDYLSYIIFGRIVRLSTQCPEEKKEVCISVKFAHELGEYINLQVTKSRKNGLKSVDFTQEEGRVIVQKSFEHINADAIFAQLSESEMSLVRRFGSTIIPDNPKAEQRPSEFRLE